LRLCEQRKRKRKGKGKRRRQRKSERKRMRKLMDIRCLSSCDVMLCDVAIKSDILGDHTSYRQEGDTVKADAWSMSGKK
jgi:hypothetical protein